MRIRNVTYKNFFASKDASLRLPDTGILLVTGENGQGKTTIVDAISYGLFDKTTRGSVQADKSSEIEVSVETDSLSTKRTQKGKSKTISWHTHGETANEFDTNTKANKALEGLTGDHDLWLRSHVFSNALTSKIATATDAELKGIIERALNIQCFDTAYTKCKEAVLANKAAKEECITNKRSLQDRLVTLESTLSLAESTMNSAKPVKVVVDVPKRRLHPVKPEKPIKPEYPVKPEKPIKPEYPQKPSPAVIDEVVVPDPPEPVKTSTEDAEDLKTKISETRSEFLQLKELIKGVDSDLQESNRTISEIETSRKALQSTIAKWPGGKCPTCSQSVPESTIGKLIEETQDELETLNAKLEYSLKRKALSEEANEKYKTLQKEVEKQGKDARDKLTTHETNVSLYEAQLESNKKLHAALIKAREEAVIHAQEMIDRDYVRDCEKIDEDYIRLCSTMETAYEQTILKIDEEYKRECDNLDQEHERVCAQIDKEYDQALEFYKQCELNYKMQVVEWGKTQTSIQTKIKECKQTISVTQGAIWSETNKQQEILVKEALLKNSLHVLGPKGVRVHILKNALESLELLTNAWLTRIGRAGQNIRIREDTTKKSGVISIDVSFDRDPNNYYPYRLQSDGEKRRVDLALVFALSEINSSARACKNGTLFFDEVFSAIDVSSVDQVVSVVEELALDRCIVVISHREDIISKMTPAMHIKAISGQYHIV